MKTCIVKGILMFQTIVIIKVNDTISFPHINEPYQTDH